MSKFGSHYTKVDLGQNENHVIIIVYCACAKTYNCLFDSLHAFLVIWAIRLIWVIRQSCFYTCPNVGIAESYACYQWNLMQQTAHTKLSFSFLYKSLVIRLTSDSSTTVYQVLVYMCV